MWCQLSDLRCMLEEGDGYAGSDARRMQNWTLKRSSRCSEMLVEDGGLSGCICDLRGIRGRGSDLGVRIHVPGYSLSLQRSPKQCHLQSI